MFISVDFPAPFSPSSAWTSPRLRSKSTWSLASTPGNRFVMPRSSRTGAASIGGDSMRLETTSGAEAPLGDPVSAVVLRDGRRDLDLPGDDLLLEHRHLGKDLRPQLALQLRADLAEGDALVLQVEDRVRAALVLAGFRSLDRIEHADVNPFDRARQDVGTEEGLIAVHSDAPDAMVLRRAQSTQPAEAGNGEDHVRAGCDLVLGHVLAEILLDEVLRVALEDGRALDALFGPGLVTRAEDVYGRDLDAADDASHLLALGRLGHHGRHAADQVAVLLRRVRQALDVVDVGALEVPGRGRHEVVRDREVRVRELRRHSLERVGHQESRGDHEVRVLPDRTREIRNVVARIVRLDRERLDLQLLLGQ